MIHYLVNLRKRKNVLLRCFFESTEVRADSVARIIFDNKNDCCTVQVVWGSDNVLCQYVSHLLLKYSEFSRWKSMGSKLHWQRITFANFVLHQLFLPKCVVVLAKTSLNARSSAVLSLVCWLLSVIAKEQICSASSMLGCVSYFLLELQRAVFFRFFKVIKSGLCFHLTKMYVPRDFMLIDKWQIYKISLFLRHQFLRMKVDWYFFYSITWVPIIWGLFLGSTVDRLPI